MIGVQQVDDLTLVKIAYDIENRTFDTRGLVTVRIGETILKMEGTARGPIPLDEQAATLHRVLSRALAALEAVAAEQEPALDL